MLACPSPACGSTNVQQLSHYWSSLPADSQLKAEYGPPTAVESRIWLAVLAVIAGIVLMFSGGVLLGLVVAVGGLLFGAADRRQQAVYVASQAEWGAARICLGCTGRF